MNYYLLWAAIRPLTYYHARRVARIESDVVQLGRACSCVVGRTRGRRAGHKIVILATRAHRTISVQFRAVTFSARASASPLEVGLATFRVVCGERKGE